MAQRFREHKRRLAPVAVCAVCSRRVADPERPGGCPGAEPLYHQQPVSIQRMPLASVPNLWLLRADGDRSEQLPREALTTVQYDGVQYCLDEEGITGGVAAAFGGGSWVGNRLRALPVLCFA